MNVKNIICIILLLPAGICMAQDKFKITGKLPNAAKDLMVVLNHMNSEGKYVNDTSLVKKGKFSLRGITAFSNKAYLSLLPVKKDTSKASRVQPDYKEFYLEKGKYKVRGTNSMASAKITGTKSQSDYLQYNTYMGTMPDQWKQITQRFQKATAAKDTVEVKVIREEAKIVMAKMEAALDSFIFNHPDSYVSVDLVNDNRTAVIDTGFDRYYSVLSERVMKSFTGRKMTTKYEKARTISIGNTFDFTQDDIEGKPFTLSSLRGKYVLVDFWASWCMPCRAENPNLLKAYQQLKDQKFEIVGISLDETKAPWLKAVEKDGLPWVQVSDLKGWKNEIAIKYGITAVPQNLIINPEGVIIAKNLRGEELTEKLAELIK